MATIVFRIAAVAVEALVLVQSFAYYAVRENASMPLYEDQLTVVLLIGFLCSAALLPFPERMRRWRLVICALKALVTGLTVLTVPAVDFAVFPLVAAALCTVGLHVGMGGILGFEATVAAMVALVVAVFKHQAFAGSDTAQLGLMASVSAILSACVLGIRYVYETWKKTAVQRDKLAADIDRLTNVNVGFQAFASDVERKTLQDERKRLSREIHDTVGYSLTTLKMMFEAGKGLIEKDPGKMPALMDQGIRLSRECLDEVRGALRGLRSWEDSTPEGLRFVTRLVENFVTVTGTDIRLDFSNAKMSYGPQIDAVLYKMVQECLTNAYRHGRASRVDMMVKEIDGLLKVAIFDNGSSSREIVKGIGMQGMEERIVTVGGRVEFIPSAEGFEVRADIPVERGDTEGGSEALAADEVAR